MPDEPKKIFDLLDIENEPTDEQLAELMDLVAESVRKKRAIGQETLRANMNNALAQDVVAKLLRQ
jgi:hypothetical protein